MLKRLMCDESGATAIEYGLIVALIAIVMVGALSSAGDSLANTMNEAKDGMDG